MNGVSHYRESVDIFKTHYRSTLSHRITLNQNLEVFNNEGVSSNGVPSLFDMIKTYEETFPHNVAQLPKMIRLECVLADKYRSILFQQRCINAC